MVSVVDLDETQEKALNLALNKTGGAWDEEKLAKLLAEVQQHLDDIEVTGFGANEVQALLEQLLESVQEDSDAITPEPSVDPITQPGDLWQLGRHRLLCGDATRSQDYERLLDGKSVAMVFTDPPYNVDYTGKTRRALKIENDKMNDEDFAVFLFEAFTQMRLATRVGGAVYVCHADTEGTVFRMQFENAGWLLKQCLIWVKNSLVMGRQDYQWQHEPILYGWKPGGNHFWYGGRNQTTVWNIARPQANKEHPTMKPVSLVRLAVENSSIIGDAVLDPFGGSGTTLIAAEESGRCAYLMEIDPRYCDVIIARWERLTGQRAVKIDGWTTNKVNA